MHIGDTIRQMRKKRGMNMHQLAEILEIGFSTLQRIETNKISPSVSLLSDIAYHLGTPIQEFFKDESKKIAIIRAGTAPVIGIGKLSLQMLSPRGTIDDRISINVGEVRPGEITKIQVRKGFDFLYFIEGKGVLKYGGREYELGEGDAVYYDASTPHAWVAKSTSKFVSINIRKESVEKP